MSILDYENDISVLQYCGINKLLLYLCKYTANYILIRTVFFMFDSDVYRSFFSRDKNLFIFIYAIQITNAIKHVANYFLHQISYPIT